MAAHLEVMPASPVAAVLAKLPGAKRQGRGWMARCPAHDDGTASLSIAEGRDGRALLNCHAGCPADAIVGALGMALTDLFPPRPADGNSGKPGRDPKERPLLERTYDYTDADGHLVQQAMRLRYTNGDKTFRQRRPDPARPGEWINNVDGVEPVLYRFPQLLEAIALGRRVYVVEGEKDVETLESVGYPATTNVGGAGKWRESYAATFAGADVVILPDNDPAGRSHAQQVAASLAHAGATVRILELPNLPPKGDVSDWFARGGTREAFEALVAGEATPAADVAPAPLYRRLDTLWADDAIMRPPPPRVPYLAWDQRSTLLCGLYKSGKSTLAGYIAAQVSRGGAMFDESCMAGTVLIVGLEEFIGDTARRLQEFGADGTRVYLVDQLPTGTAARVALVRQMIDELRPDVVLVDSLIAWGRGEVKDINDSAIMEPVVYGLTEIAHDTGVALIVLHHGRKTDGALIGSQAIGAAVDVIAEITKPDDKNDPTRRHVAIVGRGLRTRDLDYRFGDGRFALVPSGDAAPIASLEAKILDAVRRTPGKGARHVRETVGGRARDVDATLEQLIAARVIVDRGDSTGRRLFLADCTVPTLCPDGTQAGHASDTVRDTPNAELGLGGVSRPPLPLKGVGAGHAPRDTAR